MDESSQNATFIVSSPCFNAMTIAGLTTCLSLPWTERVHTYCSDAITNSALFYSLKCSLDDKLYVHPLHSLPHQTCSAWNPMDH